MSRRNTWAVALAACLFRIVRAQSPASPPGFEVASVRPVNPNVPEPIEIHALPGGRLIATNCNLRVLIMGAYGVQQYEISGGPTWMDSERFDIVANVGENAPADATRLTAPVDVLPPSMKLMFQALLADRFRLKVHRETEEGVVYYLNVAKGGPKLKPAAASELPSVRLRVVGPRDGISYAIEGLKASMSLLAERLGVLALRRPVIDKTGISGEFDFRFEFVGDAGFADLTPALSAAIRDIGLQLERHKGPVTTLLVDSAEKPSGN